MTLFYRIRPLRAAGILGRPRAQPPTHPYFTGAPHAHPSASSVTASWRLSWPAAGRSSTGSRARWTSPPSKRRARALAELRAVDAGWNQQLVNARLYSRDAAPGTARRDSPRATASSTPRSKSGTAPGRSARRQRTGAAEARLRRQGGPDRAPCRGRAEAGAADPADAAKLAELQALADALFDQAWFASTGPRLDTLARAIDRSFDDALTQAELYRVGLLYYSGFLLAVLAFLVWSLDQRRRQIDRINRQLREANETPRSARRRAHARTVRRAREAEGIRSDADPEREDVVARPDGRRHRARSEHAARLREVEPGSGATRACPRVGQPRRRNRAAARAALGRKRRRSRARRAVRPGARAGRGAARDGAGVRANSSSW